MGSHCVECAKAAQPTAAQRFRLWQSGQSAPVTMTLIAVNLAVFAVMTVLEPRTLFGTLTRSHARLGLARQTIDSVPVRIRLDGGEELITGDGEWFRLLTSGFVHYGVIHIAFNMYILYQLGRMLEPMIGSTRFALAYFASLFGGSLGVILLDSGGLTAGASGAVFGLMGMGFVGYWLHGVNPLQTGIGRLLLLNLAFTFFAGSFVSVGGHLGGAVAGALCGFVLMRPRWKPLPGWLTYAVPIAIGVISIGVSISVAG